MKLVIYLIDCVWEALKSGYGYQTDDKMWAIGIAVIVIVCGVCFAIAFILRTKPFAYSVLITIGLVIIFIVCAVAIEG